MAHESHELDQPGKMVRDECGKHEQATLKFGIPPLQIPDLHGHDPRTHKEHGRGITRKNIWQHGFLPGRKATPV
jgi:hypothetical protein